MCAIERKLLITRKNQNLIFSIRIMIPIILLEVHRIEFIVFIFSFVKIDFVKGCIENGIMCYGKR